MNKIGVLPCVDCVWHVYGRDMKEKMAGPGDKYAKDTRKYNPDFAAEHPEDEYDNKIEEVNEQS